MKIFSTLFLLVYALSSTAQNYKEQIEAYRENFKKEIVLEDRAPLKTDEVQYLRYYEPDANYRVEAIFTKTENATPLDMPTSSGKTKSYIEYGKLKFELGKKPLVLTIYQSLKLMENPEFKDYLFLPFTDLTNGEETYINGRYLEFRTGEIKDNKLIIDFNKAYNPYCAYSDGYNCPKPPEVNDLKIKVKAGEMDFGKKRH